MLDAAWEDGISTLYATSHITPGIRPFDFDVYSQHLDEARFYCRERGYDMTLCPGAEILYTPALRNYVVNHRLPTLGESNHVLLEFAPGIPLWELEAALELMERQGYVTTLAHIERYACFFQGNATSRLKDRWDIRYQVNADTVLHEGGFFRARRIRSWFRNGLVDYVASDAHDTLTRPFQLRQAYEVLKQRYGQATAERLMGMTSKE